MLRAMSGIAIAAVGVSACTTADFAPPKEFSTLPRAFAHKYGNQPYNQVVSASDVIKQGFPELLVNICSAPPPGTKDKESDGPCAAVAGGKVPDVDPTSFRCWAFQHPYVKACADAVAKHAIDQCVAKSGAQNAFTANANIVLGSVLSGASLIADAAAISRTGSNSNSEALSAALISSTTNIQKFAPTAVNPAVQSLLQTEQSYLLLSDFKDSELSCLDPKNPQACRHSPMLMKFSRLHDAVYATCPVGAY